MNQKKVFCIVVTFNAMSWIQKCLRSILSSSLKVNILVVDNGSTDGTPEFIIEKYPAMQLIKTGKNLGFGQGNNIGLRAAIQNNADHVFLLNQDAYVETDTIAKLVIAQDQNPTYGILSPIHLNGEGVDFDEYFYRYLTRSDIKVLLAKEILKRNNLPGTIINTSFVNAAAWLISKECILQTGGFDPIFYHYGEDDHYTNRALYKGFKIGIVSTAFIKHDRKRDSQNGVSVETDLKREKIIFLNQACDLHNKSFKTLMLKRLLRYSLLAVVDVASFNKKGWQYNFGMAKHISKSFNKVSVSRSTSKHAKIPYLDVEN